jgi:hypothetical protein
MKYVDIHIYTLDECICVYIVDIYICMYVYIHMYICYTHIFCIYHIHLYYICVCLCVYLKICIADLTGGWMCLPIHSRVAQAPRMYASRLDSRTTGGKGLARRFMSVVRIKSRYNKYMICIFMLYYTLYLFNIIYIYIYICVKSSMCHPFRGPLGRINLVESILRRHQVIGMSSRIQPLSILPFLSGSNAIWCSH